MFSALTQSRTYGAVFKNVKEQQCQSINYEVNTYICGINNRTKRGRPNRFVRRVGSVYMENPFRGKRNNNVYSE